MPKIEPPRKITTLQDMFQNQDYLQTVVYGDGVSPREYLDTNPERALQFYKDMHIAMVDELHEALNEIGWKPWATSRHFNIEAVKGELVDALHFFMNLCMVAKVTPEDLIKGYIDKSAKNIQRQAEGYDGVSTKCNLCARALDDSAVECFKNQSLEWDSLGNTTRVRSWCEFYKEFHDVKAV